MHFLWGKSEEHCGEKNWYLTQDSKIALHAWHAPAEDKDLSNMLVDSQECPLLDQSVLAYYSPTMGE